MGSVVDDVEYVANDATLKQVLNSAKLLTLKSQWTKERTLDMAIGRSNAPATLKQHSCAMLTMPYPSTSSGYGFQPSCCSGPPAAD